MGYVGSAAVMIAVSHGLSLLLARAIDVPIMSYGILTGVICGLAIWTTFDRGRLSMRFGASVTIVLSLSLVACCLWIWMLRTLIRWPAISFGPGHITVSQAAFQSALGFMFIWAPLQAASIWFGWRLDQSCEERPLRDGRRLRKRLMAGVIAVLLIAIIMLRVMEQVAYTSFAHSTTITYASLLPLSAMFGLLYVALVWGWLSANRLRYAIAASIPYGMFLLFLCIGPGGGGGVGWLIRGSMLLHAVFLFSALFVFRWSGWHLVPYSRAELGYTP